MKEDMIPAADLCYHLNIELSFLHTLKECGLIEIASIEENIYIPESRLADLERIVRLYEMDINLEGIETITHLLDQMQRQQERITRLVNRLRNYEGESLE